MGWWPMIQILLFTFFWDFYPSWTRNLDLDRGLTNQPGMMGGREQPRAAGAQPVTDLHQIKLALIESTTKMY